MIGDQYFTDVKVVGIYGSMAHDLRALPVLRVPERIINVLD